MNLNNNHDTKTNMDLKYVNASVLIGKIGNIKIPAYSLVSIIFFMVFQNRYFFVLMFFLFFISIYFETKQENLRTIFYKIAFIFKKRIVLVSKHSLKREKLDLKVK